MLMLEFRRRELGLTQTKIGYLADINQPLYSLVEQGRYTPSAEQLARIARVLDLPIDAVLTPVKTGDLLGRGSAA